MLKDNAFIYGAYEFDNLGQQATAPTALAPTSTGITILNALAADSQVRNLLLQFPVAPAQTGAVIVSGQAVPVGRVNSVAPSFVNQHNFVANGDWNLPEQHALHIRYLQSRSRQPHLAVFPNSNSLRRQPWTTSGLW